MSDQQQDTEQVVDLESLTLTEIRALAEQEQQQEPATPAPVRDDKGRFAKVEVESEVEEEAQPVVYRREIDLGDGSGIQVFQADSIEGLVDQLANAQLNATRKIREQAEKLRQIDETKKHEQEQYSADEEFILSQEMMSNPTKAVAKVFKKMTGYDITEMKTVAERMSALDAANQQKAVEQQRETAVSGFLTSHPDYVANPRNGELMKDRVELLEVRAQRDGKSVDFATLLEKAYQDLSTSGLLNLKSEDADVADEPRRATPPRIEAVEVNVPVQRTPRKASSLVNRANNYTAPKSNEPNWDEISNLPLEKIRELERIELAKRNQG